MYTHIYEHALFDTFRSLLSFVYFWSTKNMNVVGNLLLNIPTKLVAICLVVSEKKIKMYKFTDDIGRQVMILPRMILWVKWANMILSDITFASTSWRKKFSSYRCKKNAGPDDVTTDTCWSHAWWLFNRLHWILLKLLARFYGLKGPHMWNSLGPLFI